MGYGFFDYKYNIAGFDSDLFSAPHIVYVVLVYILGVAACCLLRRTKHETVTKALRVLAVISLVLEISKISWESYYDITTGRGFNTGGILPLYTCSLYIYTLFAAGFGRGRVREYALSFLATIGLLYGAIGVVYCNGLNFYPFWTFGAFYSLYFHSAMFVTGVFLLTTGYKQLEWIDALKAMIPILLLAVIAIPVDYILKADYMLIYSGRGVPLYEPLAESLDAHGLRSVYTVIMLLTHIPLAAAVIAIYKSARRIFGAKLTEA